MAETHSSAVTDFKSGLKILSHRGGRILCLLIAIGVYGVWGTPTPETLGWPEIITGFFLLAAIGAGGFLSVLRLNVLRSWQYAGYILLLYGLTVPLFTGIINGHSPGYMFRDIVPFLFMLLPLFMTPLFRLEAGTVENPLASPKNMISVRRLITGIVAISGWIFAARVALPALLERGFTVNVVQILFRDPSYLANAPTVLFSAVLFTGLAGALLYRRVAFLSALKAFCLMLLAVIPVITMIAMLQRAYFGYFWLALVGLLGLGLTKNPSRTLVPLVAIMIGVAFFWPVLAAAVDTLVRKSGIVGLNMRWQEVTAVFDIVMRDPVSALLGKGWGTLFRSPAVGGITVNFTHSLLTTYLLKTGLTGLALVLVYLFLLLKQLVPLAFRAPVLAAALTGPLLINIFLYASFKSLDFGLLLMLVSLWAVSVPAVAKTEPV